VRRVKRRLALITEIISPYRIPAALGVRAVDLLAAGKADRMVGWWNRTVIDVPLEKVIGRSRTLDPDGALIRTARALGICLGDAG